MPDRELEAVAEALADAHARYWPERDKPYWSYMARAALAASPPPVSGGPEGDVSPDPPLDPDELDPDQWDPPE